MWTIQLLVHGFSLNHDGSNIKRLIQGNTIDFSGTHVGQGSMHTVNCAYEKIFRCHQESKIVEQTAAGEDSI